MSSSNEVRAPKWVRRPLAALAAMSLTLTSAVAVQSLAGTQAAQAATAISAPRTTAVDVSAATGRSISGPVTAWTTGSGANVVEHVAGTTTAGLLIIFYRSPNSGGWQAVNASAEAGRTVASGSALTDWVSKDGSLAVENVAAVGAGGELLVFSWSSATGRWAATDASAQAGQKVAGGLTSWTTGTGTAAVQHIAGVSATGRLIVFWWSTTAGQWRAVDASTEAGRAGLSTATLTTWITSDGPYTVEHVAAVSTSGGLLAFHWSPSAGTWKVVDATAESGRTVTGGLASWVTQSGQYTVEHVAGVAADGSLNIFWWSPAAGTWRSADATQISRSADAAGASTTLAPAAGQTKPEMVISRSAAGGLLLHWWTSALDWQVTDLAATTGSAISGDPVAWRVPTGTAPERVAVRATNGHLLVFESAGQERQLVDALRAPAAGTGVTHKRDLRRKVLTILWDPARTGVPRPTKTSVQNAVVGATNSARDYYLQNSGGRFTIENAGVLGWYDSNYAPSEYWPGGGVAGRDSGAEAIRKAAQEFDFAAYDADNDGEVSTDELMILFILPGTDDGGGLGRVVGEDYTTRQTAKGITVDGKKITWISEVSIGAPPGPGIVAHELSHLLLDLGDMYFTYFNPYAAGAFSLMDQDGQAPHLDAASKLKLGWLHPRPILKSGTYSLRDVEHHNEAWALINPARGTKEYFIIENRWPGTSYDKVLPDKGLAVWHVIEDKPTWAGNPPPGVTQATWDQAGGWSRQGIRLIRPDIIAPIPGSSSLWDAAEPAAAAGLALKWADGTSSGFVLRNFSAAGATMQATIDVPAL